MTEYEYQVIQSTFRQKLNRNPYAGKSWKTEQAYEEGMRAAMSILHSFYNSQKTIEQRKGN